MISIVIEAALQNRQGGHREISAATPQQAKYRNEAAPVPIWEGRPAFRELLRVSCVDRCGRAGNATRAAAVSSGDGHNRICGGTLKSSILCFTRTKVNRSRKGSGQAGAGRRSKMIDITEKIKKKLQDEITTLQRELHEELPKEIKIARAHGDLSENAEYKYAKERQGYVAARLGQLHQRLANLSMLNLSNLPKDRAAYGSRLVVRDVARSTKIEYKLVTQEEADASLGLISTTSPIGRALMGKKAGDEVSVTTPAGDKEFEIMKLSTIYDEE